MRQLYIVNATQVVTSEAHPEGAIRKLVCMTPLAKRF